MAEDRRLGLLDGMGYWYGLEILKTILDTWEDDTQYIYLKRGTLPEENLNSGRRLTRK